MSPRIARLRRESAPTEMTPAELAAVLERAEDGIVSWRAWVAMVPSERRRVGRLDQEAARRVMLDGVDDYLAGRLA